LRINSESRKKAETYYLDINSIKETAMKNPYFIEPKYNRLRQKCPRNRLSWTNNSKYRSYTNLSSSNLNLGPNSISEEVRKQDLLQKKTLSSYMMKPTKKRRVVVDPSEYSHFYESLKMRRRENKRIIGVLKAEYHNKMGVSQYTPVLKYS